MWHEARKQERKIREVMINYQKRAERRREHYEKMRINPNQLIRLYGSKCQMHLDPSGGNRDSTMIPWQGDSSNMISRYDVRIHLDYIPDDSMLPKHELTAEEKKEEAKCNYERYRSLVQHSFRGLGEKEALAQIDVEEMYPDNRKKGKEKKKSQAKAAIAYSYKEEEEEEEVDEEEQARRDEELLAAYLGEEVEEEKAFSSESEYEIDMDVDELGTSQVDKLNVLALDFGVPAGAFSRSLRTEKAQLEEQKQARLADLEKSSLSGKKARRERRLLKEKRVNPRMPTPPTYARRGSPTYEPYEGEVEPRSGSSSRSPSPEVGRVEYITEFGEGSTEPPNKKEPTSLKETKPRTPQHPSPSHSHSSHPHPHQHSYHRRPRSRSRSRDRSRHHHRHSERSRSRSRGRSRERRHRRRSSSRSRERYHCSRRSHSHSPRPHTHQSRSHSGSRSRSRSPHEKRSSSSEKNKPSSAVTSTPRASKPKEKPKLTPQERLKKKMQAQLSKQFKQDKKVQREKEEQMEAQRVEREEELRDQMMRLREKERSQWDKEHEERELHRRHSRSRSRSPHGYHYSSHDNYSY